MASGIVTHEQQVIIPICNTLFAFAPVARLPWLWVEPIMNQLSAEGSSLEE